MRIFKLNIEHNRVCVSTTTLVAKIKLMYIFYIFGTVCLHLNQTVKSITLLEKTQAPKFYDGGIRTTLLILSMVGVGYSRNTHEISSSFVSPTGLGLLLLVPNFSITFLQQIFMF